ncbi:MAG: penicillin acylase family protein [Alphaproteobacteria bacterium]|nr:penicillin acylase family protein [Alphaproteobacteria bacterium]
MNRTLRRVAIGLGIFAAVLLVVATGGFLWLRTSLPMTNGTIALPGLTAPVKVVRNRDGVPHIAAQHADDAYFALGFVHAQDRLWQMEVTRRLGAGRLSEVFGARTLPVDRFVRTFGLYRLAEAQAAAMPKPQRAALDAYVQGVNAFLENRTGALPPEFVALRHTPEPWRAADSIVWSRIMAMRLSRNWRTELLRLRLSEKLTPAQIESLWPEPPNGTPITLGDKKRSAGLPLDRLWQSLPEELAPVDASNAWVLNGNRTATGKPILANDPHLGFSAPVLWYLVRMEAPGLSLTGVTVPGVPLLILGHNSRIAWGMTTTGGDVEDLYLERIDPTDPSRYMTPDGPKPFELREEIIRVKSEDPVALTVRSTRHGPVIDEIVPGAEPEPDLTHVLALASPAFRPDDTTAQALFKINNATSWADFLKAARAFQSPQQNLFFADIKGDIGMIAPGRIPIRSQRDGRTVADGEKAADDWLGFIPFEALPKAHNPSAGIIINANNPLVGPNYPYSITRDWDKGHRAERLVEVLKEADGVTLDDTAALQQDIVSPAARRLLGMLLRAEPNGSDAAAAMALLRSWDHRMSRDRPEPLIYATWMRRLMAALVKDELGDLFDPYNRPRPDFIVSVLTGASQWCDDVTTDAAETCDQRVAQALDDALADLRAKHGADITAWRWGTVHRAVFAHRLFTYVPVLRGLTDISIETDGGDHSVNRGQTSNHDGNPFAHTHGAGYRAVYDLADLDRSRFIIATGQSGNPLSPHYRDQLDRWRRGDFMHLPAKAPDRDEDTAVLVLKPATARR